MNVKVLADVLVQAEEIGLIGRKELRINVKYKILNKSINRLLGKRHKVMETLLSFDSISDLSFYKECIKTLNSMDRQEAVIYMIQKDIDSKLSKHKDSILADEMLKELHKVASDFSNNGKKMSIDIEIKMQKETF
ncbi:hypothetical protein [Bacillus cereus]|uniref:hypothetical protein n=1 Tax=Bacillus cereus TaxID=1396 RepID=UPI00032E9C12|nr:hypothetical protein [Bacillus cereus]EOO44194.1 hypothetical protein ICK_06451 [Bacillus cereus BAG1X2-2]EOP00407.1 hypothetical protein ICO_06363 [Bacillus cereus BAG2O-1]